MSNTGKQEVYGVDMLDLLTLLINIIKAKEHPNVGYANFDEPINKFFARMQKRGTQIKKSELEAALWACVLLEEQGSFYHPQQLSLKKFLFNMFNARLYDKQFNEIYCLISDKPKMGRPKKEESE